MSWTEVATGFGFPEGPAFDGEGNLYVVEIAAGQVSRIAPDGRVSVLAKPGGGPNGSAIGPDGALWVANNGGADPGRIERIDLATGAVEAVFADHEGQPLGNCNDLVFNAEGGCYFTDPHGSLRDPQPGHVFFFTLDERLSRVATGYGFPNGIGITDDGSTLLVAESGTGWIWAHEIEKPGVLGERRRFGRVPEGHIQDGFAFDAEGNVLVCGHRGGAITVLDANGKPVDSIATEDDKLTNLAFGGPDFSTIYVTESGLGRVVSMPWRNPEMRLFPDR